MKSIKEPLHKDQLKPKVVLGVAAHPDDLDFGAGGAMAAFAAEGAAIHYVIITDGGKGSADRDQSPAALQAIREQEQQAALDTLGGKTVTFLDYKDGELEVTMQLKQDIAREIRRLKPDVVVTMDPSMLYSAERGFINHPDHRAAGQATLDAVFPLARDHLSFPDLLKEGFDPHITPSVLLVNFDSDACNYCVDIEPWLEKKLEALWAHESQMGTKKQDIERKITEWAREDGSYFGYALAESFVRIDIWT